MAKYIVTGCAGFIGCAMTYRLLSEGHEVIGIDNFSNLTPIQVKYYRLKKLEQRLTSDERTRFQFYKLSVFDLDKHVDLAANVDSVLHFAAWPGIRESFNYPVRYITANIAASQFLLEWAGELGIPKVLLASSSSVYGNLAQDKIKSGIYPCAEDSTEGKPLSPYAVTKKAMEDLAYVCHLKYGYHVAIPRYFTVYGPHGRPDMAYLKFIRQLYNRELITVYGNGHQMRDFTYIEDAVDATVAMLALEGYEIINVGSGCPNSLRYLIGLIGNNLGKIPTTMKFADSEEGDVVITYAYIEKAIRLLSWNPATSLEAGIHNTVEWYKVEGHKLYDSLVEGGKEDETDEDCRK